MSVLNRRRFLGAAASVLGGASLGRFSSGRPSSAALAAPAEFVAGQAVKAHFIAAERPTMLPCFAGHTLPLWTFSETTWLPLIRMSLGDQLEAVLDNRLRRESEHTSIHWHGIRLPNDQDGVPYLVQPPVMPGESFSYSFVPPDTGTFFFHTHCNTSEQLGRGLFGILIVEGDAPEPYAADETILLRDWLIDLDDGKFRNFTTPRGAHRAGTFGNVRSANGASEAEILLPSSADCRLRIINGDPTRVMEVAVNGVEAAVIAIDGVAVSPFPLKSWLLGPAMRVDLAVRAPMAGAVAHIVDKRIGEPVSLVRLVGNGASRPRGPFDPSPLRAGRVPEPDLAHAERRTFVFAASGSNGATIAFDDSLLPIGPLCLSSDDFWAINGTAWPSREHSKIPPPLAVLDRGRSYVFKLKNGSQLIHPIHIHGHTFKVLRSDQRALPVHHADTMLLMPDETVDVAFVADNPGRWMFHCHVIEHQETGMMGYVQVA